MKDQFVLWINRLDSCAVCLKAIRGRFCGAALQIKNRCCEVGRPLYANFIKVVDLMGLKIQLINPNAKIPTNREGDAGYDLYSPVDTLIYPDQLIKIKLGIKSEFPTGLVGVIKDRSSMASRAIHVLAGVVDSTYRGEWILLLINLGQELVKIETGHKVAQVLFLNYQNPIIEVTNDLTETVRGLGGFGSTGR